MRSLRVLGAVSVCLLATVLLVLAAVLALTVVLLPVAVLLGFLALRLYALGVRLALPRGRDIKKGVRKEVRRWRKKLPERELKSAFTSPRKRLKKLAG
jgi:hypothetical protein